MLTACSKLVDNLGKAVRTQLVDGLLADYTDVRRLHVYKMWDFYPCIGPLAGIEHAALRFRCSALLTCKLYW
jgi:molybdopterin-guanine dinucleotide biosynthesis protein A